MGSLLGTEEWASGAEVPSVFRGQCAGEKALIKPGVQFIPENGGGGEAEEEG